MAFPWTFNSQDITILPGGERDDQAVSLTIRQVPYSGPDGAFLADSGGLGPETIGLSLWFPSMADYATFRDGAGGVGTSGGLNWMLGVVPEVLLSAMRLTTMHTTPGLPVEAAADFVVITPLLTGSTSYDASLPWSFTLTGGGPVTLHVPLTPGPSDAYPTEQTTRQLPGSGSGPSWYVDSAAPGAALLHLTLTFATAADFVGFRTVCLGVTGALVCPLGSITLVLLSKLSLSKLFLQDGYPVMAIADFVVLTP